MEDNDPKDFTDMLHLYSLILITLYNGTHSITITSALCVYLCDKASTLNVIICFCLHVVINIDCLYTGVILFLVNTLHDELQHIRSCRIFRCLFGWGWLTKNGSTHWSVWIVYLEITYFVYLYLGLSLFGIIYEAFPSASPHWVVKNVAFTTDSSWPFYNNVSVKLKSHKMPTCVLHE